MSGIPTRLRRLPGLRALRLATVIAGVASLGCDAFSARAWRPPDIVMISIDTLRADHLPTYGHPRPTAPNIDAWARQSLVFDRAYTEAPHTLPSHASLFTGLYPSRHGVLERGDTLAPGIATIATMLAGRQYRTAAFVNCYFLGPDARIMRGFTHFDHDYGGNDLSAQREAEATNEAVFAWADGLGEDPNPYFLFVHYFDLHSDWEGLPYHAPEPYRSRFVREPPPGYRSGDGTLSATAYMRSLNEKRIRLSEDELRYLTDLYDASIAYTDAQVGALLAGLERRGRLRDAIVVVMADHGEEFQDHGKLIHGQLYDEVMRIPLLVSLPEMRGEPGPSCRGLEAPAAGRSDALVQHVDVMPTIADCLGEPTPDGVQGQSFLGVLAGAPGPRTTAYFDTSLGYQRGVYRDGWKWLEDPPTGARQLYDLRADPRERRNLAKQDLARGTEMSAELARHRADNEAARIASERVDVSPEVHEALEALGYVEEPPAP
jgi:arylsulfatase A-like enzyme